MMRHTIVLGALCGVFALGLPAAAANAPRTLEVLELDTGGAGIGGYQVGGQAPPVVGQGLVTHADLYTWAGAHRGARTGTLSAICIFTKIELASGTIEAFCNGSLTLRGGGVEVSGFANLGRPKVFPIVAGTGSYAGARGYVRVRNLGATKAADTIVITSG